MPASVDPARIADLLDLYIDTASVPAELFEKLHSYLELLLKWNARTNLTAIREPEEIIRRHFGESLFAAQHLPHCETLLDFGSGAGFPGLPIQLLRPDLTVTLAESQNKKASFLREAVRVLGLNTGVWSDRVEALPGGRIYDVVTLRAVDRMDVALHAASQRASKALVLLRSGRQQALEVPHFSRGTTLRLPGEAGLELLVLERDDPGQ